MASLFSIVGAIIIVEILIIPFLNNTAIAQQHAAMTYVPTLKVNDGSVSIHPVILQLKTISSSPGLESRTITSPTPLLLIAVPGSATTKNNTQVILKLNGTIQPFDPNIHLYAAIVTQPQYGKLVDLNQNTGQVTYIPKPGYFGKDSFTFKVNDTKEESKPATVTIAVKPSPSATSPRLLLIAVPGSATTKNNTQVILKLNGTTQPFDPNIHLYAAIVTQPQYGKLVDLNQNTGQVTYIPKPGYFGKDSFTFKVNDGKSNSVNTGTVNITVVQQRLPLQAAKIHNNATKTIPNSHHQPPTYSIPTSKPSDITGLLSSHLYLIVLSVIATGLTIVILFWKTRKGHRGQPSSPTAIIFPTTQVVNEGSVVTLDGSSSYSSNGSITTFTWAQSSGPIIVLNQANSSRVVFTAPKVTSVTILTFELTVINMAGSSSTASAQVTINPNAKDWPAPADYNVAVQNPKSSFLDPYLYSSIVEVRKNGLPYVVSGNFASAYKFISSNKKNFCVRCFLKPTTIHREIYSQISKYLSANTLPYFANFQYMDGGIRVKGKTFPIIRMDWIEGKPLDIFVQENSRNKNILFDLSQKFSNMIQQLERAKIAHGDLQHGNIIITKGLEIKLVDYDSMYIPIFNGRQSMEIGHRNYQHIRRNASHFNCRIDNFSALVIYLSLRAIALYPTLFQEYNNGENLIFVRKDFKMPNNSTLVARLRKSNDKTIMKCLNTIEQSINLEPDNIPSLGQILSSI